MNASIIIIFMSSDFLYSDSAWEDTSASIEKTDQLDDDARFAVAVAVAGAGAGTLAVADDILLIVY